MKKKENKEQGQNVPEKDKQNKKEVNSQYLSRKKQKLQKKQAEIQSQAEHKKARLKNTRTARKY